MEYDKEFMKMAMLKHEETFKEQVNELHRLYRIQKILMKNIESSSGSNIGWNETNSLHHHMLQEQKKKHSSKPRKILDLERPAEDYIAESDGEGMLEIEDESEIELTLGPTSYNTNTNTNTNNNISNGRKKAGSMTPPLTSDSGPSFSSSSTGSSQMKKTNLGTHQSTDRTREDLSGASKWGLIQVPQQSGRKNSLDNVEEQLRQDRLKQPSWLFQVLSLNMT